MKKIIRLLLILSLVFCGAIFAEAESTPHLYGGNIDAEKGTIVSYPIYLEGNTGIAAIKVSFECEDSAITSVAKDDGKSLDFEKGEVLSSGNAYGAVSGRGGQMVWFDVKNMKNDGEIFVVKLKISDKAADGTYAVKIGYSPENTITQKEDPVKLAVTDGTITVKSGGSSSSGTSEPAKPYSGQEEGTDTESVDTNEDRAATIEAVKATQIKLKSKLVKVKGKTAISLTWSKTGDAKLDGYEVRRSVKKNSGYGTKPYKLTKSTKYTNSKSLKKDRTYYYKVRGYKIIDGKKVYTKWSNKAWRAVRKSLWN